MSMLGRHCWTTDGCLREGTVIEQKENPSFCLVLYEDGTIRTVVSENLHATSDGAKAACEELALYWQNQVEKL